jgi:spore germination protein YaaH
MSHEVLGFLTMGDLEYGAERLDYDVVSTIAFFSLEADAKGHIARNKAWDAWAGPRMDAIIEKAHANGTKVVMSLERFAWSPGQAKVARALLGSAEARTTLVRETVDEVVRRGVDGVNVDFEPIPDGHKEDFVAFVRELRAALDAVEPGYQLTYCATGYVQNYAVAALAKPGAADAVYIMGYHYKGTWSQIAGSTAPMGGPGYDISETIKEFTALTEPDRIILGVPYYGHLWDTASSRLNARTTSPGRDVLYPQAIALATRHGHRYDKVEQVAWTTFQERPCSTCKLRWRQLYFDDARSLGHKWAFVKKQGLLGTGVWAIGFEDPRQELYDVMRGQFLAD